MTPKIVRPSAVAALATVCAVLSAADADARVRDCNTRQYTTAAPNALIALTTVLNTRNMTCQSALRIVRSNASKAKNDSAIVRVGGQFRLGAYRCRVYLVDWELHRARCVNGPRAFRIDYGS